MNGYGSLHWTIKVKKATSAEVAQMFLQHLLFACHWSDSAFLFLSTSLQVTGVRLAILRIAIFWITILRITIFDVTRLVFCAFCFSLFAFLFTSSIGCEGWRSHKGNNQQA
jgi:hypothetical protein